MALMDFVQRVKNFFSPPPPESANASIASWLSSLSEVSAGEALGHPGIWRAVNIISADVAKVPIALYRRESDGSRVAENARPEARLLRERAAPGISGYSLRRTLTAHTLLTGNGFAMITRDRRGFPMALTVLDPSATTIEKDAPLIWRTTIKDKTLILLDSDVIHLSGLSWDGLRGESPLNILKDAMRLELGVQRFAAAFFDKGYALSGFIKSQRSLSTEEIARLRDEFRRRHSGASSAHDIAILTGGLEFQPSVAEPQKTQLVESRDAGLRAIANMFGLPPHKIGDPTRTSYASIEAENADYLQTTLDPWLVSWEQEASLKLIPENERDRFYFEHNRNAVVRTQLGERVTSYAKLIEIGVLSPNEVRERENLDRREGGDGYYAPANWVQS